MAKCIQIGEAGVLRVMSELILREHAPYKPAVDDHGVDLMLGNGLRIQVKSATLRERRTRALSGGEKKVFLSTGYYFSLGWGQSGRVHKPTRRKRMYSEECDYFIIWGIAENRFWIVPSFVLDNRTCLVLGPRPKPNEQQVLNLAAQGLGLNAIADKLGCCPVTVWKRKRGQSTEHGSFARTVRMCEERWDFLNVKPMELLAGDRRREDEIAALELMLETTAQEAR